MVRDPGLRVSKFVNPTIGRKNPRAQSTRHRLAAQDEFPILTVRNRPSQVVLTSTQFLESNPAESGASRLSIPNRP